MTTSDDGEQGHARACESEREREREREVREKQMMGRRI